MDACDLHGVIRSYEDCKLKYIQWKQTLERHWNYLYGIMICSTGQGPYLW